MSTRSKKRGPLKFHNGVENELLQYVLTNAITGDIDSVISTIDDFCWNNHWMMHVGNEKGAIVEKAIFVTNPENVLELGTYCGYSCLRILRNMTKVGSKVYTIDPNQETVEKIAKPILKKAGVLERVIFLSGYSNEVLPNIPKIYPGLIFEAVFFDHAKREYYPDLLILESLELIGKFTILIADNVIVFKIKEYLDYVQNKEKFKTTIEYTNLEYNSTNDKKVMTDGIVISNYV